MLLEPLGIVPRFVTRSEVEQGEEPAIHYGENHLVGRDRVVHIPLEPSTVEFFRGSKPVIPQANLRGTETPDLFGFDVVASAFYWLSGWHEVTQSIRDQHGRFPFSASLQAELDTGPGAPVDAYRERLAAELERVGAGVKRRTWNGRKAAVCVTHDLDYPRKWRPGILYAETMANIVRPSNHSRLQGFVRLTSAIAKALVNGDPYRNCTNRFIEDAGEAHSERTFFLKAGDHGRYDTSFSLTSSSARKMISAIRNSGSEIGLHPSYFASEHPAYLEREAEQLKRACDGIDIRSIRSHYLRFNHVLTPTLYADNGFFIDSTLAFAEREGFRNGTCLPFEIYDLEKNRPTGLWEMPLAVMDSTLFWYRQMNADEAFEATKSLAETVMKYGGVLVLLWHNILWDPLGNEGYGEHYERMMEYLKGQSFHRGSLNHSFESWRAVN